MCMNGSSYHHIKKKTLKNLEKRTFGYVMDGVALIAPLVLLPQVFQIFEYKNAQGDSLLTWVLLGVINSLWSVYGVVYKERLIFIANVLMMILDLVVVIGILLYR